MNPAIHASVLEICGTSVKQWLWVLYSRMSTYVISPISTEMQFVNVEYLMLERSITLISDALTF